MRVQIKNIRANPFRHIDRYPIREDKVAALIESIETTGFWDNLVARPGPEPGTVEIAYGHHRREALLRSHPADHEIGIVVREFNDEQMLQIMARENMEEWGSSAMVEHETIRAVVEAYAAGQIELRRPASSLPRAQVRFAPSFTLGPPEGEQHAARPYTAASVADFLGWVQPDRTPQQKVHDALSALSYIEQKHLTDADFTGLTTAQAGALVAETRRTLLAQQREREEAAKQAAALEAERQAMAERAARAEAEQAAALERAKVERERAERERAAARDRAERERIDRESQEREEAAEQDWKRRQQEVEAAEQARRQAALRAEAIRRENERAERERTAERERVTREVRDDLRSGGGYKHARQAADRVRRQATPSGPPPDLGRTVRSLASQLSSFFIDSVTAQRLTLVLGFRKHFADSDRETLIAGLQEMRDQIDRHLSSLGAAAAAADHDERSVVIDADIVDAEVVGG